MNRLFYEFHDWLVKKYYESYPECWARKIVWAYNKLEAENKPFYWSDIRRLSGVKKADIEKISQVDSIVLMGYISDVRMKFIEKKTSNFLGILSMNFLKMWQNSYLRIWELA